MVRKNKLFSICATVFALTFISKVLGFLREIIIGYFVGTTAVTDAYSISNVIPNFFLLIVQQVIAIAFIPIFMRLFEKRGEIASNSFTSKAIFLISLFSLVFSTLIFFLANPIVRVFATGMDHETIALTSSMVKISSWSLFLQSFVLVFVSFLQAKKKFIFPVIAGYSLDFAAIFLFWYTSKNGNYYLLGAVPVLSMSLQLIILVPASFKNGFRIRTEGKLFSNEIKELLIVSLPALLSVGIYQINLLVDKNIASLITVGGIASLNYAQTIVNLFETLIMNSIVTIAYSSLCISSAKENEAETHKIIHDSSLKIGYIIIPISIALFVFSEPIVRVLFQRGAFDDNSVLMTSSNLKGYSVGLFPLCMTFLLTRVLYSKHNRVIPIIFSAITLLINASLNYLSYRLTAIGISGVAWATSIANFANFLFLLCYIIKKYKVAIGTIIDVNMSVLLGISVLSITFSYFAFYIISLLKINIYISGAIAFFVYFILLTLLVLLILPKSKEWLFHFFKKQKSLNKDNESR